MFWSVLEKTKKQSFFPVLDEGGMLLGILRESDFKEFVYSPHGMVLLRNKSVVKSIRQFIVSSPVVDIDTKVEKIIENFSFVGESEGVLVTKNMKYIGFLDAKALLNIVSEQNIFLARNQNPLTQLPGNKAIDEYIANALVSTSESFAMVYFDFDNFKPFNDIYGFRIGDRVILLFAELLRGKKFSAESFIGHIGGDDFLMAAAIKREEFDKFVVYVSDLIERFASDAASFYRQEDRQNGYIVSNDREGNLRKFPLLSVSAALVFLKEDRPIFSDEHFNFVLAELKKLSKSSDIKIAAASLI